MAGLDFGGDEASFSDQDLFNSVEELDDDEEVECVDSEFNYESRRMRIKMKKTLSTRFLTNTVCSAHTLQLVLRDVFETS
uniref:Uncharacterized protein n=1 Tax=Ditylenchus dipsaci TaxID=166011 RepID=A0A915ELY4_9BILA